MTIRRWLVLGALLALVAGAAAAVYVTGTGDPLVPFKRRGAVPAGPPAPLVDQNPLKTARALAPLAGTPDEQGLSREALRLGDHEVDLAFAEALRDAKDHPAPLTPELKALAKRVDQSEAAVSADQAVVKGITAAIAEDAKAEALQGRLELAQAQLAVDEDELDDAKQDLISAGGDPVSRIQRLLDEHEAAQHAAEAAAAAPQVIDFGATNLIAQARAWIALRAAADQIASARQDALAFEAALGARHDALERQDKQQGDQGQTIAHGAAGMASLDKRIRDEHDLAETYTDWAALVASHQRVALHGISRSAFGILLVALVVYGVGRLVDLSVTGLSPDQRGRHTIHVAFRFLVQVAGAAAVLFVVFGVPNQTPTIVGLAGAGLTVALKDFLVAFLGWFVLQGRNGIRVGDWVEIKGVSGEVVEIGLLRTVLLETGNLTDAGHPTGRRVTFVNGYAIEGHYFNFSTSGHWLWDELKIVVPASDNPYVVIDGIQRIVTAETEANGRIAELEWQRATSRYKVKAFGTAPAIQVRPTPEGLEVLARYITRAHERLEVRARIYQKILELLHQKPAATA